MPPILLAFCGITGTLNLRALCWFLLEQEMSNTKSRLVTINSLVYISNALAFMQFWESGEVGALV